MEPAGAAVIAKVSLSVCLSVCLTDFFVTVKASETETECLDSPLVIMKAGGCYPVLPEFLSDGEIRCLTLCATVCHCLPLSAPLSNCLRHSDAFFNSESVWPNCLSFFDAFLVIVKASESVCLILAAFFSDRLIVKLSVV